MVACGRVSFSSTEISALPVAAARALGSGERTGNQAAALVDEIVGILPSIPGVSAANWVVLGRETETLGRRRFSALWCNLRRPMLLQNQPAALQSNLMSSKGRKRRTKIERSQMLAVPDAASAVGDARPLAATPRPESLLCAKGNATADGFRPSYWSYERVEAPPVQPAPAPPAPLRSIASPPHSMAYAMPPSPPANEVPHTFDYPCNAGAVAPVEEETPAIVVRGTDRALWLTTTKNIAALISTQLDGREAALTARIELQRRSDPSSSGTRRARGAAASRVTVDSLVAELEAARRGSVRTLREGMRSFDATFVALCLLMMFSAGLLGYSVVRSDGLRHAWLATALAPFGASQASAAATHIEIARN